MYILSHFSCAAGAHDLERTEEKACKYFVPAGCAEETQNGTAFLPSNAAKCCSEDGGVTFGKEIWVLRAVFLLRSFMIII
jgi:hypothetical protein